ncbi:MAG: hypothetical protein FRX48_02890 [Lasallia pustulata]|uniref:Uncharacterized protein n=1 Tax=Lasallia pustulata TaxID=136370 RepID=A0A5M8PUS5_9LECA|nr:MAG: hypothetical protein FRX48_02890 [Lasallia pustulata]
MMTDYPLLAVETLPENTSTAVIGTQQPSTSAWSASHGSPKVLFKDTGVSIHLDIQTDHHPNTRNPPFVLSCFFCTPAPVFPECAPPPPFPPLPPFPPFLSCGTVGRISVVLFLIKTG